MSSSACVAIQIQVTKKLNYAMLSITTEKRIGCGFGKLENWFINNKKSYRGYSIAFEIRVPVLQEKFCIMFRVTAAKRIRTDSVIGSHQLNGATVAIRIPVLPSNTMHYVQCQRCIADPNCSRFG
jgi:hypothetical protein